MRSDLKSRALTLSFALSLIASGCATPAGRFEKELSKNECDAALEHLPERQLGLRMLSETRHAGGVAVSYGFTGLTYAAELTWDIVGGTVMFAALCSPAIMTGIYAWRSDPTSPAKADAGQTPSELCFPGKLDALGAPPLGRHAFASTEGLRCPPVDAVSRSVRQVAACYARRGDANRARSSLLALRDSPSFARCLSRDERASLEVAVSDLK